jgi:hypothetical protein
VRRGNDLVHFRGTTRGASPAFHRSRHTLRGRAEVRDVTTRGALSARAERTRDRRRNVGHHHAFRPTAARVKRKSSLRPLAGILTADAQLGQWVARQRQEAELAAEVRKHLPRALGLRVHVTGLRDGVLELGANGGAIAATLRQRAPALRAALSADGFGVREVKVRVQVVASPGAPARGTPRSLDVRAATPLFDLAEQLPQGPLREALARWSRRARGR